MNPQIFTTQVQKLTQDQSYFISIPTYLLCLQGFFFLQKFMFLNFYFVLQYIWLGAALVSQWERFCLPVQEMQETTFDPWVRKIPLEKEMATHSNILALEISWTEELVGYSPWSHRRVRHHLATKQQKIWLTMYAVLVSVV